MRDFLARLAERAIGETPLARPRPPARFEGDDPATDEPELDVVDERSRAVGAPPTGIPPAFVEKRLAEQRSPEASPPPLRRTAEAHGGRAAGRPRSARRASPVDRGAVAGDEGGPALAPRAHASASSIEVSGRRRADPAGPMPIAQSPPGPPVSPVPRAAETRAAPAVRAVTPPAAVAPRRSIPAHAGRLDRPVHGEQGPAVRIHIGRLEVRAAIDEPSSPLRSHGEERTSEDSDGLSLADYLRGERDAR